MFTRVLTATDMLDGHNALVATALEIAKQNQGRLFVMHVLDNLKECGEFESIKHFKTGEETATSHEYIEIVKDELDKECAGALSNYQINIAYGRPGIEIRRWARKIGADLIVLGPHAGKEKGLTGFPVGNTVEDVIMHVTSPVMIINRLIPKERLNFKKVMVCVDLSESCEYAREFAIDITTRFDSKLYVFHMLALLETEREIKEKLTENYKIPDGTDYEYSIREGKLPCSAILKYAFEKDIDLIVMGSHTKDKGKRWYTGSTVEEVSTKSSCPVTVVTHSHA